MEVGGTAELRQWIQSFGSGAEVMEPETLRKEVVTDLRAALERYELAPAAGRPTAQVPKDGAAAERQPHRIELDMRLPGSRVGLDGRGHLVPPIHQTFVRLVSLQLRALSPGPGVGSARSPRGEFSIWILR